MYYYFNIASTTASSSSLQDMCPLLLIGDRMLKMMCC